jgi:hypothetical protein
LDQSQRRAFDDETRALMLRRVRIAIVIGSLIHLAFIGVDAFRFHPQRYPQAVAIRIAAIAALVHFWSPLTLRPSPVSCRESPSKG